MSRKPRERNESGIYHAILRGINQQNVFEEEEDYKRFLQAIETSKQISKFKLYAYCLMGNHVHLLLKAEEEPLAQIFKRIGVRYVSWYNHKYRRTGHLFQDRFKSESINDDSYFLTVLRYIHQNPVKAGIVQNPEAYYWSSYQSYLAGESIVDTAEALTLFASDPLQAAEVFIAQMHAPCPVECMDAEPRLHRPSDQEAWNVITRLCKAKNAAEFQHLAPQKRDKALAACKAQGLSIRQIARLTGVSFGIVRNR